MVSASSSASESGSLKATGGACVPGLLAAWVLRRRVEALRAVDVRDVAEVAAALAAREIAAAARRAFSYA